MDAYSNYEKFILVGDFNAEELEPCFNNVLYHCDAKNVVKEKTCFKIMDNPRCIDLFPANSYRKSQNTTTVCTGLSDFHKMTITVIKSRFQKAKPKEVLYRDDMNFVEKDFKSELRTQLEHAEIKEYEIKEYETFESILLTIFNKHAPCKKK